MTAPSPHALKVLDNCCLHENRHNRYWMAWRSQAVVHKPCTLMQIPGPKAWSILYRAVNSIEFNVVLTTADFNRGRADCWGAKRESFVDHMGFSLVDVTRFTAFEASGVSFDDDKSVVFHSFLFMCSFIADGALNNRQGETGLSKGDRAFLVLFCLRLAVMIWSIFCMPVGQDIRARAVFSGAVKQDGAVISVPSLWDTLQEFLSRFEEGVLAV